MLFFGGSFKCSVFFNWSAEASLSQFGCYSKRARHTWTAHHDDDHCWLTNSDTNIRKKEHEKLEKHQGLKEEREKSDEHSGTRGPQPQKYIITNKIYQV